MGVITGIRGLVNEVDRFQDFSATADVDLKEVIDASTGGSRRRIPGTQSWNATYNAGGIIPDHFAGEVINFLGSIDGEKGLSGQALITQTTITIPISENDPIMYENTLYGLDNLEAGPAVVEEPTVPIAPDYPKGICVQLANCTDDVLDFVSEVNTSNIVITFIINPAEYVDCSTDGARSAIEGTWDVTVDYDRNVDDFDLLPDRDSAFFVRIPVIDINLPATEWYEFQFMRPGEWGNMSVNRAGDFVTASVPLAFSSVEKVGTTTPIQTRGKVILPGGSIWRPL